ncbi:MAG: hypothetical protein Q8P01_06150 [bacterium]|nr:hypothetical protein [bacterium]
MKGHIIVERESKKGWVFVPDEHIRFEIIVLEEEAALSASRTYPEAWPGLIWSLHMEATIKQECDFVSEVIVPAEMMCLAWHSITRNDIFNSKMEDAKKAYERTQAYGKEVGGWPGLETMEKEPFGEREYPSAMRLNKAARFALYRQVQGWILETGGLA